MVGLHHRLNGHEFEQTLGDSEELGSLVCCSPWGCKELYMTEILNNNNSNSWSVKNRSDNSIFYLPGIILNILLCIV